MTHYSIEFRSSIVARLLPPNNASVADLAKETGVPKDTLYGWLKRSRNQQGVAPFSCKQSDRYSADDKLAVIIETASLNETELGEFCRRKGIYPVQIANWKDSMVQGLTSVPSKADREQNQKQVRTIQQLEKDLARKDKALAEVVALVGTPKKVSGAYGGPRGRKIIFEVRQEIIVMLDEAVAAGARLFKACEVVKLSIRTVQRYRQNGEVMSDGRKAAAIGRVPANRLSDQERIEILEIVNQPGFANLPPSQIVPALADYGRYIASESSFYRILREENQLAHRGKAKAPSHSRPQSLEATAPNQLWSWDITYLATTVKGLYFYLYLILDVFSRKIVGWEIYSEESAEHAAKTFHKAHLREGIGCKSLVLHSDNGSPMKGATMLGMLQKLGVVPSFSRPSVSNDNPYSESLFKTMKYRPDFPDQPFDTLDQARQWATGFTSWYNEEHHHSAIKFVTPGQRHRGEDSDILAQRMLIYEAAKVKNPERWASTCRNWERPVVVTLNHTRTSKDHSIREIKKAA